MSAGRDALLEKHLRYAGGQYVRKAQALLDGCKPDPLMDQLMGAMPRSQVAKNKAKAQEWLTLARECKRLIEEPDFAG